MSHKIRNRAKMNGKTAEENPLIFALFFKLFKKK